MTSSWIRRALAHARSLVLVVSLTVLALTTTPLLAVGPGGGPKGGGGGGPTPVGQSGGGGGGGGAVPEINANAAAAALTLLGGMTLILTDRLRRRQLAQASSRPAPTTNPWDPDAAAAQAAYVRSQNSPGPAYSSPYSAAPKERPFTDVDPSKQDFSMYVGAYGGFGLIW